MYITDDVTLPIVVFFFFFFALWKIRKVPCNKNNKKHIIFSFFFFLFWQHIKLQNYSPVKDKDVTSSCRNGNLFQFFLDKKLIATSFTSHDIHLCLQISRRSRPLKPRNITLRPTSIELPLMLYFPARLWSFIHSSSKLCLPAVRG